jgi:hypothetical protein
MKWRSTKGWASTTFSRSSGCHVVAAFLCFFLVSCSDVPDDDLVKEWERKYQAALVPQYRDFEGLYINGDMGISVFEYKCPTVDAATDVFAILRKQNPTFTVVRQTSETLILEKRRPSEWSRFGYIDRFQFVYDGKKSLVTVISGDIDSSTEENAFAATVRYFQNR